MKNKYVEAKSKLTKSEQNMLMNAILINIDSYENNLWMDKDDDTSNRKLKKWKSISKKIYQAIEDNRI